VTDFFCGWLASDLDTLMSDFAKTALQASQAVGSPLNLAYRLGVEPYDVFRWIAGLDVPQEPQRRDVEKRIRFVASLVSLSKPARRRHADRSG
jgi:hypothetical protein